MQGMRPVRVVRERSLGHRGHPLAGRRLSHEFLPYTVRCPMIASGYRYYTRTELREAARNWQPRFSAANPRTGPALRRLLREEEP